MEDGVEYEIFMNNHANIIRNSLKQMLNSSIMTDVTIVSESLEFIKVHKLVLVANSDYFKEILENTTSPVTIVFQIQSPVIKAIVDYMYSGRIHIDSSFIKDFVSASNILKMSTLSTLQSKVNIFGELTAIPFPVLVNNEDFADENLNPMSNISYIIERKDISKADENSDKPKKKYQTSYTEDLWNTNIMIKKKKKLQDQEQNSLQTIANTKKLMFQVHSENSTIPLGFKTTINGEFNMDPDDVLNLN